MRGSELLFRLLNALKASRWYIQNVWQYLRRYRLRGIKTGPVAYFDLHRNIFHRYLLNFMLILNDQGFHIQIDPRSSVLATWNTNLLIRFVRGLEFSRHKDPRSAELYFTDSRVDKDGIFLDADYFNPSPSGPDTYTLPMSMVDSIYFKGLHSWSPSTNAMACNKKVFFAGNMGTEYTRSSRDLKLLFSCISRDALLKCVQEHYTDRIYRPGNFKELLIDVPQDIVLVDRKISNVPLDQLRSTLFNFDFFLAAPGVIMPLCHNVIEALSVGCIPILQYAMLFEPELEHGVNCLSYRNEAELKIIIDQLPSMNEHDILGMRRNALHYYTTYLSPEAVVGRITSMGKDLRRLRMNAEHHSVDLLRSHLDTARPRSQ